MKQEHRYLANAMAGVVTALTQYGCNVNYNIFKTDLAIFVTVYENTMTDGTGKQYRDQIEVLFWGEHDSFHQGYNKTIALLQKRGRDNGTFIC